MPAARALRPFDCEDFVILRAPRRCDLNLGTFLLPDKRPGERRGERDFSPLRVRLGLAHDFPHGFLFRFLVEKGDRRAEGDRLSRQLRCIDYFGARELILQLGDASLIEGL